MQMNEVIDAVMSGKRLKKFAAKYALLFFCLTLAVSALKLTVPFFKNPFGSYLLTLFSLVIEAPLVYGLMRGIVKITSVPGRLCDAGGAGGVVGACR